jgi:hypothetical protein
MFIITLFLFKAQPWYKKVNTKDQEDKEIDLKRKLKDDPLSMINELTGEKYKKSKKEKDKKKDKERSKKNESNSSKSCEIKKSKTIEELRAER